jgi:predicted MPP superfamily phosphohydrolase
MNTIHHILINTTLSSSRIMIVFIGDIHGRDNWKDIVSQNPTANTFVFLGDYFDSKEAISGPNQMQNFLEILEFKRSIPSPKKVILLFGNHDYHYMPWHTREPYSGYQKSYANKIQKLLVENFHDLQMAYSADGLLCTHAGVSHIWMSRNVGPEGSIGGWNSDNPEVISLKINELFKNNPKKFDTQGFESSGNEPQQTPIWIRPPALVESNKNRFENHFIQVFGHTQVKDLDATLTKIQHERNHRYYPVDSLALGIYWVWMNQQMHWRRVG